MSDQPKTPEKPIIGRPFQPGNPGGPGRPRKKLMTSAYEAQLQMTFPPKMCKALDIPLGSSWAEALTAVAFRTALKSSEVGVAQRKEISDRVEGRPKQRIEFGEPGSTDFEVRVTFELPPKRVEDAKAIEAPIDVKQLPPGEVEADDDSPAGE